MVNRTAKPLSIQSISEYNALGLKTGDLTQAYLGDGNHNLQVLANGLSTSHYGKYWIRLSAGTDGNGNTAFSQAIPAMRDANAYFPMQDDWPLLVYQRQTDRQWVIAKSDMARVAAAGVNPNAYNLLDPALWQFDLEKIRNFRMFTPATNDVPSALVTIEPLLFMFDGALFNAGKTTTDNVDLSSYIPAVGLERLVVIGVRANDRTIQIISGATRTIETTNYALSDVQTLVAQLDYHCMPNRAVRLANDAGVVREKDLYLDLRQFVNVQEPRGVLTAITRHVLYLTGYHENVVGDVEVSGTYGALEIQTGGSYVIL